jgi:hypothetical protein
MVRAFRRQHVLDLLRREVGAKALGMRHLQAEFALAPAQEMALDHILGGLLVLARLGRVGAHL